MTGEKSLKFNSYFLLVTLTFRGGTANGRTGRPQRQRIALNRADLDGIATVVEAPTVMDLTSRCRTRWNLDFSPGRRPRVECRRPSTWAIRVAASLLTKP